uniref:RING finger protein 17 n=1 Tax=Clastoptera arizonana TaxID=38151 RepID=A0A1B6D668_9HEMI
MPKGRINQQNTMLSHKHSSCVNCNNAFMIRVDFNFLGGSRCPRVLNCGHSVCEGCINILVKNQEPLITCNTCEKTSPINSNINSSKSLLVEFPLNSFVVGQIILKRNNFRFEDKSVTFKKKPESLTNIKLDIGSSAIEFCGECNQGPVFSRCIQCDVPFCDECFKQVHHSAKALQKHIKVPIDSKSRSQQNLNVNFCTTHRNQKIEVFCNDCDIQICLQCFFVDHKNHITCTVQEKNIKLVEDFEEATEEAKAVLNRLKFTQKKVNDIRAKRTGNKDFSKIKKDVIQHFSYLHGLLQLKETEILDELGKAEFGAQASLVDISDKLDFEIKELNTLLEIGNAAVEPENINTSDVGTILGKLKTSSKIPCHLVLSGDDDNQDADCQFEVDNINDYLNNHCSLILPSIMTWNLSTEDELPEGYVIEDIEMTEPEKKIPKSPTEVCQQNVQLSEDESITSNISSKSSKNTWQKQNLKPGFTEQVILSHLITPNEFYVQNASMIDQLNKFSVEFSKYAKAKKQTLDSVKLGQVYLVKYNADNKWYRGKVIYIFEEKIDVIYIDYGNIETTDIENMRSLPLQYLDIPELAFHCRLCDCVPIDGTWKTDASAIILSIIAKGEMTMHVFRKNPDGVYEVDLSLFDIYVHSVRDALIFLELATLTSADHQVPIVHKPLIFKQEIKSGASFTGLVVSTESPNLFYVQKVENNVLQHLKKLMDDMDVTYSNSKSSSDNAFVYTPVVGSAVAAQYSLDKKWYRAIITGLPGNRMVEVYYIDYGNSEILSWDQLRHLHDRFKKMSCQALRCSLADIKPNEGTNWSSEALLWFSDTCNNNTFTISVFRTVSDILEVVLYEIRENKDVCINGDMVKNNFAQSTGPKSLVVDVPRYWSNKLAQSKAREQQSLVPSQIVPSKQKINSNKKHKEERVIKTLKSPTSSISSRQCDSISTDSESIEGSEKMKESKRSTASEKTKSSNKFTISQSTRTAKSNNSSERAKPSERTKKFETTIASERTIVSERTRAPESTKTFERAKSSEIIKAPESIKTSEKTKASERTRIPKRNREPQSTKISESAVSSEEEGSIQVDVLNIVSPSLLYVSNLSREKEREKLSEEMVNFYSRVVSYEVVWKVNDDCAVFGSNDLKWYRGIIIEITSENKAKIFLRDIGSFDVYELSSLLPLDQQFLSLEDAAIKCHLIGVMAPGGKNEWPMYTIEKLEELLREYDEKFIKIKGDIVNESLPIELFVKSITVAALEPMKVEWKCINQMLVDQGCALPVRNKEDSVISSALSPLREVDTKPSLPSMEKHVNRADKRPYEVISNPPLKDPFQKKFEFHILPPGRPKISWLSDMSIKCFIPARQTVGKKMNKADSDNDECPQSRNSTPKTSYTPDIIPLDNVETITDWLPPEHLKTLKFHCIPTYIDYECNIYLQNENNRNILQHISSVLKSKYRGTKPLPQDLFWFPDQLCIASYHVDNMWYRGKVLKIKDDNTLDVVFVDYGNEENMPASQLRKTILATDIPIQCYCCNLAGIFPKTVDGKWTTDVLDKVHALIVDKECEVELEETKDGYVVLSLITSENVDIFEYLCKNDYATYFIDCEQVISEDEKEIAPEVNGIEEQVLISKKSTPVDWNQLVEEEEKQTPTEKVFTQPLETLEYIPAKLPKSDRCLVEVTGVVNLLEYVVQVVYPKEVPKEVSERLDKFSTLLDIMQEEAESLPPLMKIEEGAVCCANFTDDDRWYRAIIMVVIDDTRVKVQYVDYGNTEVLNINRVRSLKPEWALLPLEGIPVLLSGVNKSSNWDAEKAIQLTYDIVNATTPYTMQIMMRSTKVTSVKLFTDEGKLAYQPLIDANLLITYD